MMARLSFSLIMLALCAACAPGAPPTVAAEPPAKAMSLDEVLAIVDLREFPAFPGATRSSSTIAQSSFSAKFGGAVSVPAAIEFLTTQLEAAGWKALEFEGAMPPGERGADLAYTKDGLIASLVAGVSLAPPDGEDINAGLFLLGNVDARSLPLPAGAEVEAASPSTLAFRTAATVEAMRQHFADALSPAGWVEYRVPDMAGYTMPPEVLRGQQSFLRGAVSIGLSYQEVEGQTRVIARPSVVVATAPIPEGAKEVHFDADPLYLFCLVPAPLDEVKRFYLEAMAAEGWSAKEVPPSKETFALAIEFQAEGRKPITLECLVSRTVTFVELKERR
jgi:hypothetical protein